MSSSKQPSPLSSAHPLSESPNLATIASMLHEAAQALLTFGTTLEKDAEETCADKPTIPIEEGYRRGEFHQEIRCFRLPRFTVRREYELLRKYRSDTFFSLVTQVYEDLFTTAMLMRNFDENKGITGFDLQRISENIFRPLDLLNTICSQLADFELVQKTAEPV